MSGDGYRGWTTVVAQRERARFRDIAYYSDVRYPHGRGANLLFSYGLVNHLNDALESRGYAARARDVDASALRAFLRRSPERACLLMLDGILPTTVRDARTDLLRDWILAGGTVVWAGEPFDALFSDLGSSGGPQIVADYSKWPELYDGGVLERPEDWRSPDLSFGTERADRWKIARIPFTRTTFGVVPEHLAGGVAFGYLDARGRSSLSVLPIGRGRVVLFADGFDDEIATADTIAQVLFTQLWQGGAGLESRDVRLDGAPRVVSFSGDPGAADAYAWTQRDVPSASAVRRTNK